MKTKTKANLIILLATMALVALGFSAIAQPDSTAAYWLAKGGDIASQIQPDQWVSGVDNTIVSSVITLVGSFIVGIIKRRQEKKKLRKQGKLND